MDRPSSRFPSLEKLESEQQLIVDAMERISGLRSRWSGRVVFGTELSIRGGPLYRGIKEWNCDIKIHEVFLETVGRYSTQVHEAFHSISVGLTVSDYAAFRGLEEGVVEQCTRLFRDEILAPLNVPEPLEVRTSYDIEIALLENLREQALQDESTFYLDLLRTPLRGRENVVIQWILGANIGRSRAQLLQEISPIIRGLKP